MEKFTVQLNLEHVQDARAKFAAASRAFSDDVDRAMKRLIHEAAAQMMSPQEVAKLSGFTTAQIKTRMKALDLNPTKGKRLLSKHAADVLSKNAQLLGIEPSKMDLMSPLAYLPAGDVSAFLETQVKPDIEEMLDEPEAAGFWCPSCEFFEEDRSQGDETWQFEQGVCRACGCAESDHIAVNVVKA